MMPNVTPFALPKLRDVCAGYDALAVSVPPFNPRLTLLALANDTDD